MANLESLRRRSSSSNPRLATRRRLPFVAVFITFLVALVSPLPPVGAISGGSTKVIPRMTDTNSSDTNDSSNDNINDNINNNDKDTGKRRGKVLEERFDEQDLLRAYEEIKLEYHEKAFGGCARADEGNGNGQQAWKLLTTMNPNKKRRGCQNDNDDDEIIRVSMLEHPSDPLCPYVKMETLMPMSLEKCWDFLSLDKWDETMPKMDPFYEGLDIYGEYSVTASSSNETNSTQHVKETATATNAESDDESESESETINRIKMILARKRTKRILAFGKREFVFVSVEDTPLEDGTWVSGTVSVEVPETTKEDDSKDSDDDEQQPQQLQGLPSLRRNKSYTRAFQDSIAFYKPESKNGRGRTRLTIVCRIDLNDSSGEHGSGGCIPMWLYVKTIGITGARSVLSMRKCLLEGEQQSR